MGSISRFIASVVTPTQETTVALASLNFDFSLFKVDAPTEFHGLGAALSPKRRDAAEHGQSHITARKLSALFEQLLPQTPNLFRCYGTRSSEIAADPSCDTAGSPDLAGLFQDQVGIDGTSIWAAATSGRAAIAVHLLACMLARIWSGSEATSIWVELVEKRKAELSQGNISDIYHHPGLVAAQIILSRDHLAAWDNSARTWLRAADQVKSLQQKQLMLIVKNISIPVDKNQGNTYRSVINAWTTALSSMEKIINGAPLRVHNGAILLGLSSWHIYPDLEVLGNRNVEQRDPLVPKGGVLTVGLENSPSLPDVGVYWSLPLAHYKFYGPPKLSKRTLCGDTERLNLQEFLQVCLGSFLSKWKCGTGEILQSAKLALEICLYLSSRVPMLSEPTCWIKVLKDATSLLLDSRGVQQELQLRLVGLGKRRCALLLNQPPAYFGLSNPELFFAVLKNKSDKITFLRRFVSRLISQTRTYGRVVDISRLLIGHRRRVLERGNENRSIMVWTAAVLSSQTTMNREHDDDNPDETRVGDKCGTENSSPDGVGCKRKNYDENEETSVKYDEQLISSLVFICGTADDCALYGDPVIAREWQHASYSKTPTIEDIQWALQSDAICATRFLPFLGTEYSRNASFTSSHHSEASTKFILAMRCMATVWDVYSCLPGATISIQATSGSIISQALSTRISSYRRQINPTTWSNDDNGNHEISPVSHTLAYPLNREETFALIAYLESGGLEPNTTVLRSVMAMSSADSLFIAHHLLQDPEETVEKRCKRVKRIQGSIDAPGIAFLVSPKDPMVKEPDKANWNVINHARFTGQLEDCFKGTSLHLSFTDYKLPIDVGVYGSRDAEIFLLEAVVSVHDSIGKWVADLDVLSALDKMSYLFEPGLGSKRYCTHQSDSLVFNSTAVDSWDEFLDKPSTSFVFRARKNWIARLAAATISVQRSDRTVILPSEAKICWGCVGENYGVDNLEEGLAFIC